MRTIQTTVYKFTELSETAKQNAVNELSDINVDHNWWECTYEDADFIGADIKAFDIDRGDITIEVSDIQQTAHDIVKGHGEHCETYKLAKQFIEDSDKLVSKYSDGVHTDRVSEDNIEAFDEDIQELEGQFVEQLGECYLSILRNEYEYRTSEAAIIETIEANDYEFTEGGELI